MFKTTLKKALDRATTVTAAVSTGLGTYDQAIAHRVFGEGTVTLDTGDEEYQVEFALDQEIEIDAEGQAHVKDIDGEPHTLTFERTVPLAAEHLV